MQDCDWSASVRLTVALDALAHLGYFRKHGCPSRIAGHRLLRRQLGYRRDAETARSAPEAIRRYPALEAHNGTEFWRLLDEVIGSGLLLQRLSEVSSALAKVIGALPQFVEQPHVLDGDDGLGAEVL